jgi:RNA polymerase sigma-70 factor (ECF subfamily)
MDPTSGASPYIRLLVPLYRFKARQKDSNEAAVRINNKRSLLQSDNGATSNEQSDEILVAQVARGNSAALEILYDRHAPTVLGFLLKFNPDQASAEDVLQEIFWRVWRYAPAYQPQLGSFAAWLFRIARNLAVDHYRKHNIRPQALSHIGNDAVDIDQMPDLETDVAEQAQSSFRHQQVRIALAALPDVQRQVLEMAYFLGMTRQEIAEATGEALGTVHTRARLGLQKLRRELEDQKFEG